MAGRGVATMPGLIETPAQIWMAVEPVNMRRGPAYYKRIRFSTKSEALAPLQRDVFEKT